VIRSPCWVTVIAAGLSDGPDRVGRAASKCDSFQPAVSRGLWHQVMFKRPGWIAEKMVVLEVVLFDDRAFWWRCGAFSFAISMDVFFARD
jgi:hypothetical protein